MWETECLRLLRCTVWLDNLRGTVTLNSLRLGIDDRLLVGNRLLECAEWIRLGETTAT